MKQKSLIIYIATSLIIITCLVLFIIGLRLYIINKDEDIKKLNTPILLMSPIVVVSIVILFLYIDYKYRQEVGLPVYKF